MNILLVNDDGYEAEGIQVLRRVLSAEHNVYVVAPSGNRSAFSHHISMHNGLEIVQIEENVWSCSGSPADCTFTALRTGFIPQKIDMVISGINHGANLGTDIVYSGTCAAAREGALLGYASVALSLEYNNGELKGFEKLAQFTLKNLNNFLFLYEKSFRKGFINVNCLGGTEYSGAVLSEKLSRREYDDNASLTCSQGKIQVSNRDGKLVSPVISGSDEYFVKTGYISVNVVNAHPECLKTVEVIDFSV